MNIDWNTHRFSGGVLALDLVNTVIFRQAPDRSEDRLADPAALPRFSAAAAKHRADEWGEVRFTPPASQRALSELIGLRESLDRLFRSAVRSGGFAPEHLSDFLGRGAAQVRREPAGGRLVLPQSPGGPRQLSLSAAAVLSAMRLFEPARAERIAICPNCHWLYFDASRNRSRRWCDMRVCGNRAKARRHYGRKGADHG
ncbi:MAG: CGNR zinc finger domain-containing protein [Phyllobacterium sp.]